MSYDPYYYTQLKAVSDLLQGRDEFFERKVKRWYSKTFHTSLHLIDEIPWEFVLQNYYEGLLEQKDHNEVYDIAISLLPKLSENEEAKNEAFAEALVEEQKRTIEKEKQKQEKERRENELKMPGYISDDVSDAEYTKKKQAHGEVQAKKKKRRQSLKSKQESGVEPDSKPNIPTVNIKFDEDV